jgi:hypothetical protein
MSWRELVHVRIDEPLSLSVTLGWPVLLLVLLAGVLPFTPPVRRRIDRWRAEEMDVAFGGIKIHVKRTNEVIRIAHAAWTEVVTRKAAIPYDPADDLIVEIYDSWYALFTELRALTRSVPAEQLRRSQDARELVNLLEAVLNQGLRPHLTKYQARFRRWFDHHTTEYDTEREVQEIQWAFPEYDALVDDLSQVNAKMVAFAADLRLLAHGGITP